MTTSVAEKAMVMVFDLVLLLFATKLLFPSVTELMVVFGGFVFTVQMNAVGVGHSFPTLSSDLTSNV